MGDLGKEAARQRLSLRCLWKTNNIVLQKLNKRKLSASRVEFAGNGCREGMNGGAESCVLATETEGEIRVCMCAGEREFSWRKQAVQLCVCCIWSCAKYLLLETAIKLKAIVSALPLASVPLASESYYS